MFWGGGIQKQKIKIVKIHSSFKNLLTKEWPKHRQSHLSSLISSKGCV